MPLKGHIYNYDEKDYLRTTRPNQYMTGTTTRDLGVQADGTLVTVVGGSATEPLALSGASAIVETFDTGDTGLIISNACFWNYVLMSGTTNFRAGQIMCVWDPDSTNITYNETTTPDIGDTSDISFDVNYDGTNVTLLFVNSNPPGDWSIKYTRRNL